jgi:mono/diheme cytochrome c family protein
LSAHEGGSRKLSITQVLSLLLIERIRKHNPIRRNRFLKSASRFRLGRRFGNQLKYSLQMRVSIVIKRLCSMAILAASITCLWLYSKQPTIHAASHERSSSSAPLYSTGNAAQDNPGAKSYAANCAICHGDKREGILPAFPPLIGVGRHMNDKQIIEIVQQGKDRMPGNPELKGEELTALLHFLASQDEPIKAESPAQLPSASTADSAGLSKAGGVLYQQSCAFCHGRDTMGGESGPDLTQSKLVLADVNGDKIGEVVRAGRPEKKMPAFNFSAPELQSLATFIHSQAAIAAKNKGDRRGVSVADLQTGNAAAGKLYFDGAGNCAHCHSPTGDLAGVAKRYQGLDLEKRMLYPEYTRSKATVTLPSGQKFSGTLAYLDEFSIALRDSNGAYRSWLVSRVKYIVDSPVEAHVDLFSKYTDANIHDLMAYLQTLR